MGAQDPVRLEKFIEKFKHLEDMVSIFLVYAINTYKSNNNQRIE